MAILQAERVAAEAARLSEHGNWAAATRAWKQASDHYSLLNDQGQEAVALHNLAHAERVLGWLLDADAHLRQAARINEHIGKTSEWWRNQIALLQLETESGQTNEFEARFTSLLQQTNRLADPAMRGLLLNELGLWQQSRGELAPAELSFAESQSIFRGLGDRAASATAVANIARLRETTGPPAEAARLWREALTEFEELGDPFGVACALAGLGRSLTMARAELPLAEDSLRRAARNFALLQRTNQQRTALLSLVECLRAQGQESQADATLQETQRLLEKRDPLVRTSRRPVD